MTMFDAQRVFRVVPLRFVLGDPARLMQYWYVHHRGGWAEAMFTVRKLSVAAALVAAACSANAGPGTPDQDQNGVGIGYGVQDRNKVAGAVGSVTRADIERMQFASIEDLIRSRVPGVLITRQGGSLLIRMRGPSTILGNPEPLIVVDGVPLAQG